jgi:hypothetical protein
MQRSHAIALITVLFLIGCGTSPSQVAVQGTVTYDGDPVQNGQVAFEPRGEGKMQFGIVSNGNYSIPTEFGLVPGEYLVRITASRPTGKMAEADAFVRAADSLEINEQFIPAKYNTNSDLVVTIEPVAEATHDFSLSSN